MTDAFNGGAVVIARKLSEADYYAIENELRKDGKIAKWARTSRELVEILRDGRVFCIFIGAELDKDVVHLIRAARQMLLAEWFLVAPEDDKRLHYRAVEAGVKGVLTEPVTPFQYVQRTRQVQARFRVDAADARFHKDVRGTGTTRTAEEDALRPEDFNIARNPLQGMEVVRGTKDYRIRHPQWERVVQTLKMRAFQGLTDYKSQAELDLLDIIMEEPRASLSLMTLRPVDPLAAFPPAKVRTLVSSDLLEETRAVDATLYPDVLKALELRRSVVVPDVRQASSFESLQGDLVSRGVVSRAAIPLMSGDDIVGMVRVQFGEPVNVRIRNLLDDLVPFSENLVPTFSKLDFLSRIYAAHDL